MTQKGFLLIFAQLISFLGTYLTDFSLNLWIFQTTQSETWYGLILAASLAPAILAAPWLGRIIDRYPRQRLLILGNLLAGVCSLSLLVLYAFNKLTPVAVFGFAAISSFFIGLSIQTTLASIVLLVKKPDLSRAQGWLWGGFSLFQVTVPLMGILLYQTIQLKGIFLIDILTFLGAIVLISGLSELTVPQSEKEKQSFRSDMKTSWAFLKKQKILLWLLGLFSAVNFALGMVVALFPPWVLSRYDERSYGFILSVSGVGMFIGQAIMILTNPQRGHMNLIIASNLLMGIVFLLMKKMSISIILMASNILLFTILAGIMNNCTQVSWQTHVPVEKQGRVFGIRTFITDGMYPMGMVISGYVVENVLPPFMGSTEEATIFVFSFVGLWLLGLSVTYLLFNRREPTRQRLTEV